MADGTYQYEEGHFRVTDEMKNSFHENGFLIIKGLLDQEEIAVVWKTLEDKDGIMKHCYTTYEADGRIIRRITYAHPGNDVFGLISRSEKVAGTCEELLGGEVYHYHAKFIMKDAKQGGQIHWHQDYGYWYNYGVLFPDLISAFIAVDPCTSQNGCLQVVPGSNKCGRIDHTPTGNFQTGADINRVQEILNLLPAKHAELQPGDALFIHCNILHTSMPNDSDVRRWAFIACYNKASNNPIMDKPHPRYTPMQKVPNSAIRECTNFTDFSGKDFKNPPAENDSPWPRLKDQP